MQELQTTISSAFQAHLFTHLYPRSTISIALHVLSLDGALLVACLNAASLALVDAGVPMPSILSAVSAGSIPADSMAQVSGGGANSTRAEPVLDLNAAEELELPFLSIATVAGQEDATGTAKAEEDRVSVLLMESRCEIGSPGNSRLEGMLATGVDGCKEVRRKMEDVIRTHGARVMLSRK